MAGRNDDDDQRRRPFSYQIPVDPVDPNQHQPRQRQQRQPSPLVTQHVSSNEQANRFVEIQSEGRNWPGVADDQYSYIETPIEDSTQDFGEGTQPSIIQRQHEEAQARAGQGNSSSHYDPDGIHPAPAPPPPPPETFPPDKQGPERMPSAYQLAPPSQPHPAFSAAYADANTQPQTQAPQEQSQIPSGQQLPPGAIQSQEHPQQQQQQSQPPHSPGVLPLKTEADFPQPSKSPHPPAHAYKSPPLSPPIPLSPGQSKHQQQYAQLQQQQQEPSDTAAPFSPYSASPPDLLSQHRPGQTTHPNMSHTASEARRKSKSKPKPTTNGSFAGASNNHVQQPPHNPTGRRTWRHSLFSCGPPSDLSTCLTGIFCPCILYSKLLYRLSARSRRSDPGDLLGFSSCNAHCTFFGTLCLCGGLSGLLAAITSARVRHTYDIEGSFGEDALKACCCCCCCAVVQAEREVRGRELERGKWAGPAVGGMDLAELGKGGVNGAGAGGGAAAAGGAPMNGRGGANTPAGAAAVMEPDQEVYARRDGMLYQSGGR
ncbi:MAG: hypothetical protein M1831_000797 [Alyxoria varia]|nr:MAG: hypothetical protein M1831_000797 [Alyxoria varia]